MHFNTLIIMNEDAVGYGNRSRKPSGYCKLTMPNRVSCYVQGLRPLPKDQTYTLYLISKSKQRSVEVGTLQVGTNGNKETRWIMNPASINNSGIKAEEIDGAFIIVSGEDIKDNIVPLVGFSSEAYIWEHLIETKAEAGPSDELAETKVEVGSSDVIAETKAEMKSSDVIADAANIEKDAQDDTKLIDMVSQVDLGTSMREEYPIFAEQEPQDDVLELKQEIEKLNRTIEESKSIITQLEREISKTRRFQRNVKDDKEHKENDRKELDKIFEKRIPINPFEAQNTGVKWVRITYEDLVSIPSLDDTWTNQAMMIEADRDYKHFILGRDDSKLTYYLGIPGIFDHHKDEPLRIDKIERFSCCHDVPAKAGEAGYWIAII